MWFDVLIKDGYVIDGTGNPWFKADVGIKNGKIIEICNLKSAKSEKILNAKGLIVSPGFIDIHTHSCSTILLANKCESHIMQGVTTEVLDNCGTSTYPITDQNLELVQERLSSIAGGMDVTIDWRTLDDYIRKVETAGISVNAASLVGHGTVRGAVIGMEDRAPTSEELGKMKELVDEAMRHGAFGLTSGPDYLPGSYAETSELIELSKVVAKYGGIYASHIREQNLHSTVEAVRECIEIGEKAGVREIQVSHYTPMFPMWGEEEEAVKLMEEARNRGVDVAADLLFVSSARKKLNNIIPPWWRKEGSEELIKNLREPKIRKKIIYDALNEDWYAPEREKTGEIPLLNHMVKAGRWSDIKLCSLYRQKMLKNDKYIGKSLAEIADIRGVNPFDALFDLIIEEKDNVYGLCSCSQDSVRKKLIKHPLFMVATDSSCKAAAEPWIESWAQPLRDYGPYAYLLGNWVREERVLTLEEMIRKMTSFPAQILGLRDRGLIVKGMYADIVVFDKDTIEDKSTHDDPHQYPEGIEHVLVNGKMVVEEKKHTDMTPGKFLRHKYN
jgi:N-acyl-D-amino-acid deacylase